MHGRGSAIESQLFPWLYRPSVRPTALAGGALCELRMCLRILLQLARFLLQMHRAVCLMIQYGKCYLKVDCSKTNAAVGALNIPDCKRKIPLNLCKLRSKILWCKLSKCIYIFVCFAQLCQFNYFAQSRVVLLVKRRSNVENWNLGVLFSLFLGY